MLQIKEAQSPNYSLAGHLGMLFHFNDCLIPRFLLALKPVVESHAAPKGSDATQFRPQREDYPNGPAYEKHTVAS